jgi:hypothetical protein
MIAFSRESSESGVPLTQGKSWNTLWPRKRLPDFPEAPGELDEGWEVLEDDDICKIRNLRTVPERGNAQ